MGLKIGVRTAYLLSAMQFAVLDSESCCSPAMPSSSTVELEPTASMASSPSKKILHRTSFHQNIAAITIACSTDKNEMKCGQRFRCRTSHSQMQNLLCWSLATFL